MALAAQAEENEAEALRKNREFAQVYPKGWQRMRVLIDQYPLAARLYAFLAEHMDASVGAVVASQEVLAEKLGVSRRSIIRAVQHLESNGALVKIKVQGTVYAYALDPKEVWKSWDTKKDYAAFNTKTLARKRDNTTVERRLKVMLGQPELPGLNEPDHDPETGEVLE